MPGCADPPGVATGNLTWRKPYLASTPVKMSAGKVSRRVRYSAARVVTKSAGCAAPPQGGAKIRQPGKVCRRVRSAVVTPAEWAISRNMDRSWMSGIGKLHDDSHVPCNKSASRIRACSMVFTCAVESHIKACHEYKPVVNRSRKIASSRCIQAELEYKPGLYTNQISSEIGDQDIKIVAKYRRIRRKQSAASYDAY